MIRKAVCWIMFAALMGCMALRFDFESAHAEPRIIVVPDDYSTIQEAINNASNGDTVFVKSGIYYENIDVNKTVSLIGENRNATIIDGLGSGTTVFVRANNVVIDNLTIQGGGSYGILLDEWTADVTISNNLIVGNAYGIYPLGVSSRSIIVNNTISNNQNMGVRVVGTASITNNTITSNGGVGVAVYLNSRAEIRGCNISNNWGGIWLSYSGNNILRNNRLEGNIYNLGFSIDYLWQAIQDIDTSNTVNGKPIYYLMNQNNLTVDPSSCPQIGFLGIVNSTNILVKDLESSDNGEGILLAFMNNSKVENVSVSRNFCGILLVASYYNSIVRNTIVNNDQGIRVWGDTGSNDGDRSSNNTFSHNNCINNSIQVYPFAGINIWDNGCEGNYWSNYAGTDANGDGIGDTAHIIDANNTDGYPLMNRYWNPSDINHDLKIDMKDVGFAARAFWTRHGNPDWNPRADITGPAYLVPDGKVDMRDIAFIARRFGEAYI